MRPGWGAPQSGFWSGHASGVALSCSPTPLPLFYDTAWPPVFPVPMKNTIAGGNTNPLAPNTDVWIYMVNPVDNHLLCYPTQTGLFSLDFTYVQSN